MLPPRGSGEGRLCARRPPAKIESKTWIVLPIHVVSRAGDHRQRSEHRSRRVSTMGRSSRREDGATASSAIAPCGAD